MPQIYSPWQQPTETGSLIGDFAGPQLDPEQAMISPETGLPEAPGGSADNLRSALAVIQHQSGLISRLMEMLGTPRS